jgi:hypothetical protein
MTNTEKHEEGVCTRCNGDDVKCLDHCTRHVCVDCGHVQQSKDRQ